MRLSLIGFLLGAVLLAGCGQAGPHQTSKKDGAKVGAAVGQVKADRAPALPAEAVPAKKVDSRKIIYNGRVELIVDEFDKAEKELHALIKEFDGRIANADVTGEPGTPRAGTWTVRIPAAKFEEFLSDVKTLGELRKQTRDTQDVSDQYYDIKAEIANLEAREEALRKLYKEKIAGTKLAELLEVDRELSKVRGDINRLKGQIQRWDNLVEYSTIILNIRDRKGYVPPTSPDFGTSIGRTFSGSIDLLVAAGKALVIAVVALAPWLAVFAVLGAMVVVPTRMYLRKRPMLNALPAGPTEPPPVPPAPPMPTA